MREVSSMVGVLLLGLTMGCTDGGGTDKGTDKGGDAEAGEVAYDGTCAVCHGANGGGEAETGYTGATDLSESLAELSDDEIATVILEGTGTMPAQSLTAEDADNVIAYLHEAFGASE